MATPFFSVAMLVLRLLALSATTYGIDTGHMLHAKSEGVMHPQVAHVGKVLDSLVAGKATTDTKSDTRWTHGVLLCLLASTLSSLGVVIQKYAHNKTLEEGDVVECSSFSFYSKGWWIGGFCIWTTAQLINMCAMGLAPQTMLSCFGSWTIICNVLIARMILGELITSGEALGMLGILMGVVFVIMGAPHKILFSGHVQVLASQFVSPSFIFLTLGVAASMFLLHSYCRKGPQIRMGLYWAFASGVLAGYSALLFKCVSLMILHVPDGMPSPWHHAEAYCITACALLVGCCEIHTLNLGLKNCQAVVLVPVYLSLGMLAQIVTNGVFFKEFSQFSSKGQVALFLVGVAMSIIFVAQVFIIRARSGTHKGQELFNEDGVLAKADKCIEAGGVWQATSSKTDL